jgi:OmpA-OmpF porin, OOP family
MQRKLLISAAITGALLSGCATQSNKAFDAFQPEDLNAQVKSGKLVQKINSFVVLNDSSSSMGNTYIDSVNYSGNKLDVEKDLLHKINKTIPAIPLNSALRSFGFGSCTNWGTTESNQGVQKYTPAGFDASINTLACASGGTPLADALTDTAPDLAASSGNIALIVLSDGMDDRTPLPAVEALKQQYGDRLCISTIWVGNEVDAQGQADLQAISDAGASCGGVASNAAALGNAAGVSDFVKKVFFKAGNPVAPAVVDGDDDQDGVLNSRDKCPDTPHGAVVDRDGCWAFHGVFFHFNSAEVTPKAEEMIHNVDHVLRLNPTLTLRIEGHTDSIGSDAYNLKLSDRRAASVKNALVKLGIGANRLTTVGYGESHPAETNATEEGRAYNRRVSFTRTDR